MGQGESEQAGELSVAGLIACYERGVFPMADSRDDDRLFLVDPPRRGLFPLDGFHVPARLARFMRGEPFAITIDQDFRAVMEACGAPAPNRPDTWISEDIIELYTQLHARGLAHSVECRVDGQLVGGLYGVSLGAAFFGESMFSRVSNASKVALVALVSRLIVGGYRLLDTQFYTDHLGQFGAIEIPRRVYLQWLAKALDQPADFARQPVGLRADQLLQSITQTSV